MSAFNRPLMRLAAAIRAEMASHRAQDRLIQLPAESWGRCAQLAHQIRRAELRGWHLAADELRKNLRHMIPSVQTQLSAFLSQLPVQSQNDTLATTGQIFGDLVALEAEFDAVEYDLAARWLSVTTEPIELDCIYLGPFEIRLEWERVDPAYRVIAKDPHPCESRENVTHPHVMDEILCEGHSKHAVRQALAQGRILDFFTLVANGLRTYNPESPFVELALWHGQTCSDCGAVVDEEDRYLCRKCEETICDRCEISCCACGDSCCSQCIVDCEVCNDNFCRGCLQSCNQCQANVCPSCITDDERCTNCHEKDRQNRTDQTDPAPDNAAIQSHRVGQALVSA